MKRSELRHWTKVELDGGGYILVRPEGPEFTRALVKELSDYRTLKGLPEEDSNNNIPNSDFLACYIRASIGTTFGGFGNIEDDNGNPLPGGNPNNLNHDICLQLLEIDDISDAWVENRNKLSTARKQRLGIVEKNSSAPTVGGQSGDTSTAVS